MTALLLETSDHAHVLRRTALAREGGYDEKWLQALLFEQPGLIPIDEIAPGSGALIPICRELALPRAGGNVLLDMLAVTRTGQIVLIECKLWRNPQARREVVAQILEYAALLRGWSYGDLSARLIATKGFKGANPLYDRARHHAPDLDETRFVEAVSASLATGNFHLIIAGDGIRSDLDAMAAHLNGPGSHRSRLSLLEIQLWFDGQGRTIVLPQWPMRTEIIEQRLLVLADGTSLQIAPNDDVSDGSVIALRADPEQIDRRNANRSFWDRFIAEARFDHPDQPTPRHGGNNWARLKLPGPMWLTAYRTKAEYGVFATMTGEAGARIYRTLVEEAATLATETALPLIYAVKQDEPFTGTISAKIDVSSGSGTTDTEQQAWLVDTTNRFVNLLRPRL